MASGRHILITGANGFVGKELVRCLLDEQTAAARKLTLVDLDLPVFPDPRIRRVLGSIADREILEACFDEPVDCIYHLACVPGGAAEENFDLGRLVNLDATLALLDRARKQTVPPVFVYTGSIGVFGNPPPVITDDTPPSPNWSYGTHKAIGELLVADFSRKGFIDGRTVRLPAIVIRPPVRNGALSIFQSDLLRSLLEGQPYVCPVSSGAVCWWMSVQCCAENLLRAADLPAASLKQDRTYTLPPLRCSVSTIVNAIERRFGLRQAGQITYAPNPELERRFGAMPRVALPAAEALGFRSDGDANSFIQTLCE